MDIHNMLDFYCSPTPNARKISIMLDELAIPYRVHEVDILAGEQFKPDFLAINPNNKIPAIIDSDGPDGKPITLWETGAIMFYLAEKHRRFLPVEPFARYECMKWLMFQMASIGPMGGQHAFFRFYAREKVPMAIERYHNELNRQMRIMNDHLGNNEYFCGTQYSIADMAIYPWWFAIKKYSTESRCNLERWADVLAARPAVAKGMDILMDRLRPEVIQAGLQATMSDDSYSGLYGSNQYVLHSAPGETPSE
jgi:GSH-dependent disulfide-bond oxidoreductase